MDLKRRVLIKKKSGFNEKCAYSKKKGRFREKNYYQK